jgi:hypothetical protein
MKLPTPAIRSFLPFVLLITFVIRPVTAQLLPVIPPDKRGRVDAERMGIHDANNIRTMFYNFGMVGDYPPDPQNVDLTVFYSVEVPKGTGMNYSDGQTPFVLSRIIQRNNREAHIMETGYRERQGVSPIRNRVMRFAPRPGFFEADPTINQGRSPAISSDPRTWPREWPDKLDDPDDPGWGGSWNGYFGKRPAADQESFAVMDDDFYDAWDFYPDARDDTRRGLALKIEVRGFQWSNPQSANVIFWHYDIANEGTTDYNNNVIFGMYMDSGIGGSMFSCDGVYESDDDNAYFERAPRLNLTYTWDNYGHGVDLRGNCSPTGYLGYAFLETPGNPFDGADNDRDGVTDERRDSGPGMLIEGQDAIRAYVQANYNLADFEAFYGPLEDRPAFRAGRWWTGDENMNWVADLHDTGIDGIWGTNSQGEGDGIPTAGEPNFDRTDLNESDQIGLTGFKFNRIRAGAGNPTTEVDQVVFFDDGKNWPKRLFDQFSHPDPAIRFDAPLVLNFNIGFLFASGPFILQAGRIERFSLALAYGGDLNELRRAVRVVQQIYDANYQFAVPPPMPTLWAEAGDGYVKLSWNDVAEKGVDPVTGLNDFEGYRIYRSTDPEFRDPRVVTNARGTGPIGHGRPIAQFDLKNGIHGFSNQTVEGIAYYLGDDSGITHTWTDTTVTNGQLYYYAVTAYDHGSDIHEFYPSENSISISRTLRGGTILPQNVVEVRSNPKVLGFTQAKREDIYRREGDGVGEVDVQIVNSEQIPDGHTFILRFDTFEATNVRADFYELFDSTMGEVVISQGFDLGGEGTGAVGSGLLPIVKTLETISIDTNATGFISSSPTNTRSRTIYQTVLPINQRRPGFPDDITITFYNEPADTSIAGIGLPARPAKFRVIAHTDTGDIRLRFRFRDPDADGTLSRADEYIDIVTYDPATPTTPRVTWRVELDTTGQSGRGAIVPPAGGDVYRLKLLRPFGRGDAFAFKTVGQSIDEESARNQFSGSPYVVPNPYVGFASFEPERFAVSGRGERRIEFRGLPAHCTIRIYTVSGHLVQTLRHDGSNDGYIGWNLRTKDNLDVAPGLYIFHVDADDVGTYIGKFSIIK